MASITYLSSKNGTCARIRISMGFDERGRQIVRSMTYHPPAGLSGEQIRENALVVAQRFERRVKQGELGLKSAQSLEEFWEFYLTNRRGHLSEPTLFAYSKVMEIHVLPQLGELFLDEIETGHVRLFVDRLTGELALKPRTVHKIYSILRSVLALAVELDVIERSPCDKNKIKLPKTGQPQVQFYDAQNASQILINLSNEPVSFRCMVQLALFTGMRRGEVLALKWDDLDLEKSLVYVSKSQYKISGKQVETKGTKTLSGIRKLSLPEGVRQLLIIYKVQSGAAQDELLFTGRGGKPISPDCFSTKWRQFLQKYHMPHKKLHSLRHSTATLLLSQGLSVADVSAQLGHSSIRTTAVYTHALSDSSARAAIAMENLLMAK